MRAVVITALAGAFALAACRPDRPAGPGPLPPPMLAHVQDLEGTPDLIVDAKRLADSWVVYDQTFDAGVCSVIEGGVLAGEHRVLRFTVTTPNIGDADVFVGDPLAHMDPNGDGDFSDQDGLFEFASCHNHFHFRHYATYELVSPGTGHVWKSAKRGFCMLDITPWQTDGGVSSWVYRSCGTKTLHGFQGISVGYADTYNKHLGGQYFVLDGGDNQAPILPGLYIIRITVNPPFVAARGEACPHVDPHGFCHQLLESNYDNNVGEVLIMIPDHPGKQGFGPGSNDISNADLIDDENRPDKP